jgi:hypothetical protein
MFQAQQWPRHYTPTSLTSCLERKFSEAITTLGGTKQMESSHGGNVERLTEEKGEWEEERRRLARFTRKTVPACPCPLNAESYS